MKTKNLFIAACISILISVSNAKAAVNPDDTLAFGANTNFFVYFSVNEFPLISGKNLPKGFTEGSVEATLSENNQKILFDLKQAHPEQFEYAAAYADFLLVKACVTILTDPSLQADNADLEKFAKLAKAKQALLAEPILLNKIVIEKAPTTYVFPYINLGFANFLRGDNEAGRKYLEDGVKIFPQNEDLAIGLSTLMASEVAKQPFFNTTDKNLKRISELLEPFLGSKKFSEDDKLFLAKVYYRQQQWEKAWNVLKDFDKVKNAYDIVLARALTAYHLDKKDAAKKFFAQALSLTQSADEKSKINAVLQGM